MAQSQEVQFGVLNIGADPHPPGIYPKLLMRVARSPRQFWGADFAAITPPERVEAGIYLGTVLVWTELDPDAPAVNKDTLQEIRLQDTAIVVPDNLGLNSRHFFYVLREKDHKIFYESRNDFGHHLAPNRFKLILDRLFSGINLKGEMTVAVTVWPDEDGLNKVLSIPHITKLRIFIELPNADQNDDALQRVWNRLKSQGAKSQEIVYNAKTRKKGIQPNADTREDAEVAADNGVVSAEGFDGAGKKVPRRSTEEYPKVIPYVIEGAGSALAGLIAVAKRTVLKVRKRLRDGDN